MSEPISGQGDLAAPDVAEPSSKLSAGAMLKAARESQGMDLSTLATLLKVAPRKLEELEADAHGALQGPAFVRALAQAACRVLKLDPAPVLSRLPALSQHTLEQVSGGLNAPFRERGMRRDSGADHPWAMRGFAVIVAVLILSAAILLFWPASFSLRSYLPGAAPVAQQPAPEATDLASLVPAGPASTDQAASAAGMASSALPPPSAEPVVLAGPLPSNPSVVASAPAGSLPVPAQAAVLPPGSPALRVVTRADSWVEVVDGAGKTLVARTLAAGEDLSLDGAFPMRVKVGNVAATELRVRGQIWDLAAVSRDNVARTELK